MANQLIVRYTLLLSLGAIMMMSVSGVPRSAGRAWQASIDRDQMGVWKLTSSVKAADFAEYLKAMEFSEGDQNAIRNSPYVYLAIKQIDDGQYNYKLHFGEHVLKDVTFRSGHDYRYKLLDGRPYKATISFDGPDKMIVTERHDNFICYNVYDFTEFVADVQCNGVRAKQLFVKVSEQDVPAHLDPY